MRHLVVVATRNAHKVAELRALFAGLPIDLVTPMQILGYEIDVVEDGATFEANATKKAKAIAKATQAMTLADDSGLEVDALAGAPGVRSARYAHDRATDADNNAALIAALSSLPPEDGGVMTARFRCVLALIDPLSPQGFEPHLVEGVCEGAVATSARGQGGFGYDPLFIVAGGTRTMAELSEVEKNQVSHRGKAARAMFLVLEKALAARAFELRALDGAAH
jgi:XTP/dITP diphosphohydrolase